MFRFFCNVLRGLNLVIEVVVVIVIEVVVVVVFVILVVKVEGYQDLISSGKIANGSTCVSKQRFIYLWVWVTWLRALRPS